MAVLDQMVFLALAAYLVEMVIEYVFYLNLAHHNQDVYQGEPGDSGGFNGIVPGPRGDPGIPGRPGVVVRIHMT